MADKQCSKCGSVKDLSLFPRPHGRICLPCRNARQRESRASVGNAYTHKYEKTPSGFLMRAYRNMQSRVTGVQWRKHHLYAGLTILPRDEFYHWANESPVFPALFQAWVESGYSQRLTPSVDRINPDYGYEPWNMEWVTHSENSRRASLTRGRKERIAASG